MASWADVMRRLQDKRSELVAEIERVDNIMSALRELERIAPDTPVPDSVAREATRVAPHVEEEGLAEEPRSASRERNLLAPSDIAAFARETLVLNERPMKRGALVRAMEARGLILAGGDKAKNLGTILWRHKDSFVNIPSLGYWPADVPLADVWNPNDPTYPNRPER